MMSMNSSRLLNLVAEYSFWWSLFVCVCVCVKRSGYMLKLRQGV